VFRLLRAVLLATILGGLLAAPAFSASVPLGGSPLNVIVGDQGQLQAFRSDRTDPTQPPGIFYRPTLELGDAGTSTARRSSASTGTSRTRA
jgi:hypothetical protein